ncbi:dynamin family protein [Niallia sp. Sow4_A1]|uniref:dynamin family protein n=1 Tax=unclassified Niallia TaxID=2837522 RepID=UPI00203B66B9|nr:dynamin family protein [Niallia sp. MER TA 168]MCM3364724.1 dynamin family protein [Niallia sp. MER TA 168]
MIEKAKQILETLTLTTDQKEELVSINKHLERNELYIAFLGKFSAGKSYLINELIERPGLLPTKVTETTAIVTEVRKSAEELAVAEKVSGTQETLDLAEIKKYIQGNNGIESIEKFKVSVSTGSLPEDIVLVDTPGRNTIHESHIRMSENAILDAEAAVYVLSTAGVSKEDLLYLKHISQLQPNLYFVLNKIDRLLQQDEGEDLSDVILRLEDELATALSIPVTVYSVSAKEGYGMEELRNVIFQSIAQNAQSLKQTAAEQRMRGLIEKVKDHLVTELHFINTSINKGEVGLEEERAKILADQEKIERLIENDRLKTMEKWHDIRSNKRSQLESQKIQLKQLMLKELVNINSKGAAEQLALLIQDEILSNRKEFIDQTLAEMKEQSKHDLQLQIAEIEKVTTDIHIPKPNLEELEQYQQEQFLKLAGEVESLQQKYQQLVEIPAVDVDSALHEHQLQELQDELQTLKGKLDVPYVAQFVERERSDANYYQEMLTNIGKLADVAVMFVPVAGQAKAGTKAAIEAGKLAAKEGSKQVIKESAKAASIEVAKVMAKEAGKEIAQKTGEQLMKEKAVKALKLLSFEGIGEKIGAAIDHNEGKTILVEDGANRSQFYKQKYEIEQTFMQKKRELNQKIAQQAKSVQEAKLQEQQKQQLEALKAEKERKLVELQSNQEKAIQQAIADSYKAIAEEKISVFINEQMALLDNWLTAESLQIEHAVSAGLQSYYKGQFEELEQQLTQVESTYKENIEVLLEQKAQLTKQVDVCEEYLGVVVS